jgi:Ca2+-binding EF-hand superfamily protein
LVRISISFRCNERVNLFPLVANSTTKQTANFLCGLDLTAVVGNDKIDLQKVKTIMRTKKLKGPLDVEREMRDAFRALDKDGNGQIAEVELRQILGSLGDALNQTEVR